MLGERADTRRISIHAPPRGATKRHSTSWKRSLFQFTPLREGRRAPRSHATPPTNFNSRPSARGDPRRNAPKSFRPPFQFTPLREGRLLGTMAMARGCLISIHAPPRGATSEYIEWLSRRAISIHAPPRGATDYIASVSGTVYFNSRPSARGDQFQPVQD